MGALGLFEKFAHEVRSPLGQAFAFQELGVTENRGQRIVQLMRYARNQLSHCRHLFTLQQLLLSATQVFISAASLFVKTDFLDSGG